MVSKRENRKVVNCRFTPGIYDLIKMRAEVWGISDVEAVGRLVFIGEIVVWAMENIVLRGSGDRQASGLEAEAFLDAILGWEK